MTGLSTWRAVLVAGGIAVLAAAAAGQDEPGPRPPFEPAPANKPGKPAQEPAEASAWDTSELAGVRFGSLLAGPDPDVEALRGNVVVVFFWNALADRSVAELGQLKRFHDASAGAGLAVLAGEVSKVREKAYAAAHSLKPNFPVMAALPIPQPAILSKSLTTRDGKPYTVLVYDHTGTAKVAFPAFSNEARDAVIKYLRLRPHPILGAKPIKKMTAAAAQVRAGQYGPALKACQAAAENAKADEETKAEAALIARNLQAYAEKLTKLAVERQPQWPSQTLRLLGEVQRLYRGSDPAQEAGKLLQDLQKDKAFLRTRAAEQDFLQLRAAAAGIPSCPATGVQDQRKWQSKFGAAAQEIRRRAALLKKNYPDTWHAEQAEALVKELTGG